MIRITWLVCLLLASLALSAATTAPGPAAASTQPCGTAARAPRVWQHVVWIVMENKRYDQIIGSDNAPYVNALARQCGLATNFRSLARPSLPNYIALTSGSTQGIADDGPPSSHTLGVPSIFSQLRGDWRALVESMPATCVRSDAGALYAVRHNPAVYYSGIRRACARQDVPLRTRPNVSARFTFVTPNLCHDMHACGTTGNDVAAQTRVGDGWLAGFIPKLLASPEYASGTTAIFITWDEPDAGSEDRRVATLVISPSTRAGTRSAKAFDHYSLLRTTEDLLGIRRHLGQAASALGMRGAFRLS